MGQKWCISRLFVLILLLSALSLSAGCAPTGQNTAKPRTIAPDTNVLRVGVSTNSPPLIFKQNHKITGLEADLARELAKHLGKSLRFVELKREDQIQALMGNRIDIIMSGMSVTQLRRMRMSFTIPYFKSTQMPLIRRKDAARLNAGLYSVETIGVIKGTTGEEFVETAFSSVNIKSYSNPRVAVKDLIKKKIDMFIYDAPMVLYLASENETKGLTVLYAFLKEEDLAWGVRKDNVALVESANNFLRSFNETGELSKIIKYWIPLAK
jgi:polar amino acid transport system substrate-binding protein